MIMRSRAYRLNEDDMAGLCDASQVFCLALGLWNGADPIVKERIFGLPCRARAVRRDLPAGRTGGRWGGNKEVADTRAWPWLRTSAMSDRRGCGPGGWTVVSKARPEIRRAARESPPG